MSRNRSQISPKPAPKAHHRPKPTTSMPIGATTRPVPIHRTAREAILAALGAMRVAHRADPWVLAALIDVAFMGWGNTASVCPPATRVALRLIRVRAHEMKLASMRKCVEQITRMQEAAAARGAS